MTEPHWERVNTAERERWDLTEIRNYTAPFRGAYHHVIGSIMRVKNNSRCRDWVVHYSEVLSITGSRQYLGRLDDMRREEAKTVARMLILAQRSNT